MEQENKKCGCPDGGCIPIADYRLGIAERASLLDYRLRKHYRAAAPLIIAEVFRNKGDVEAFIKILNDSLDEFLTEFIKSASIDYVPRYEADQQSPGD